MKAPILKEWNHLYIQSRKTEKMDKINGQEGVLISAIIKISLKLNIENVL